MKNLADLKRRLKVGAKLHGISHREINGKDLGIREIALVQSTQAAFKTEVGTLSWFNYPKASELKLYPDDPNKFTITYNGIPLLTYTFINY